MGEMVTFPANGGTCGGYVARPASGSGAGVVVFQEWWGLNAHIKDICERFASEGFVALAPDLYHGAIATEPDEAGQLMMAMNIEQAARDAHGAVQYLKELTGGPVGTTGFCMGGALSLFTACANGDDVGACVDYYGVHPAIAYPWDGLTAPVTGFWAQDDDWVTPNLAAQEAELRARGTWYESVSYPGTGHGFFNDTRPEAHNPVAAAHSWGRSLAFFRDHLKAGV